MNTNEDTSAGWQVQITIDNDERPTPLTVDAAAARFGITIDEAIDVEHGVFLVTMPTAMAVTLEEAGWLWLQIPGVTIEAEMPF